MSQQYVTSMKSVLCHIIVDKIGAFLNTKHSSERIIDLLIMQ